MFSHHQSYGNHKPPPLLTTSVKSAAAFYDRRHAVSYFRHCKAVLDLACSSGIVEGDVIRNPHIDMSRRWANSNLAELALYHVVEFDGLSRLLAPPPALTRAEIRNELDIFCKLTALERKGVPVDNFVSLLGGSPDGQCTGHPPLALLLKLLDYAVTHDNADRLRGLVHPKNHSVFRSYGSVEDAHNAMQNDARAGEMLYAPVAELFGYPSLAGSILEHSYRTNHPLAHAYVTKFMSTDMFRARLKLTQEAVAAISSAICADLFTAGFEVQVFLRPIKNPGKVMRKVLRYTLTDFDSDEAHCGYNTEGKPGRLASYFDSHIPYFNMERIHDWVTFRIILHKFKGKPIDEMSESDKLLAMEHAVSLVRQGLSMQVNTINTALKLKRVNNELTTAYEHLNKRNGYSAHHLDTTLQNIWNIRPETPLSFEVQLKTSAQHEFSEVGGAAHFLYIGGDGSFMRTISEAYYSLLSILCLLNGKNGLMNEFYGFTPRRTR